MNIKTGLDIIAFYFSLFLFWNNKTNVIVQKQLLSHHTVVWGYLVYCFCLFFLFFFVFFCTVTDFSAAERARGVKFCTRVGLLPGQIFSHFGDDWLAGSHGGGGITSRMNVTMKWFLDE